MTRHFVVEGRPVSGTNSQQIIKAPNGRRLVLKSKAQRRWRDVALEQLTAQRGAMRPITTAVAVTCVVYRQTRAGDTDNYVKGVGDALQSARIVDNDACIAEWHVIRRLDPSRPRIEITITPSSEDAK